MPATPPPTKIPSRLALGAPPAPETVTLEVRTPTMMASPTVNPAELYLARLPSPMSRERMRRCLKRVGQLACGLDDITIVPWHQFRYEVVETLRAKMVTKYKPATVNLHLVALRGVIKVCRRLEIMPAKQADDCLSVGIVKASGLPVGRMLDVSEILALHQACADDATPRGRRDTAMLAILLQGGLRRSEVVDLDVGDVDLMSGSVRVRHGKGRKERMVYCNSPGALAALRAWLEMRGDKPGPIFCATTQHKNEIEPEHRLTHQAIYKNLRTRAKVANVKSFTPHDFRRTFGSTLIDLGADMVTVRDLMGHASVETTARYDRRGEERKVSGSLLIQVPSVEPSEKVKKEEKG